jgi:hypothetical protein
MKKVLCTKKNETLPSNFDEQIEVLEKDGAKKMESIPHKFEKGLVCVIQNGENSESISFDDKQEFRQFRNTLLRSPSKQNSVTWLHYPII